MSDEQTIKTIREVLKRHEDGGCSEYDDCENAQRAALVLLSMIEARDAEIERLRAKVAMWEEIGAWLENAYPYAIAEAILATPATTTRRGL